MSISSIQHVRVCPERERWYHGPGGCMSVYSDRLDTHSADLLSEIPFVSYGNATPRRATNSGRNDAADYVSNASNYPLAQWLCRLRRASHISRLS